MGMNAHARPGDMAVVHSGNTQLMKFNPEDISGISGFNQLIEEHIVRRMPAGEHLIILGKVTAGSSKMGHLFLVLARGDIGWVYNHEVMVWD